MPDRPLSPKEKPRVLFFGCHDDVGHYLIDREKYGARRRGIGYFGDQGDGTWQPMGWKKLDNVFVPPSGVEGEAALHHKDGWTVIAWADYSIDTRPGSNCAFIVEGEYDFDSALRLARECWPGVFARFDYEIRQVPGG